MKDWQRLWRIGGETLVAVAVALVIALIWWYAKSGPYEQRFDQIQIGMTEATVEDVMGSEDDLTRKKYRITGDERQRVWVVTEKGYRLELVVVFGSDSRVLTKEIYKTRLLDEVIFKDL
jgi:hypothetical protein